MEAKQKGAEQTYDGLLSENASLKTVIECLNEQYKEKKLAASECDYLKRKFKLTEADGHDRLKKTDHHLREQLHKAKEETQALLNINLKTKEMTKGLFECDVGESWLDPRCNSSLHVELRCKYSSCDASDRAQCKSAKQIAHELGSDWKDLLLHLDMKHNQIQVIEGNYQRDIHRQAFEALISWRDTQTSTEPALKSVERLKQASSSIDRKDIVDLIESVLKELLTDKTLKEIAYRLSKNWQTAFLDLGMKYTDVVMIERDYCSDLLQQAFEALILWRNVHSKKLSHHEMLIQLKNVAHNIQTRAVIELIDKIETGRKTPFISKF
ncbi:unnamed protein product [Mytilus edulis]|uniref:Death domain-containing protein n=1 Tax=Mytilus edulis TaxID=6550 RepID=A0A8S3ULK5_MYTED|nr:unnamed protein product [Mytilus edulis]